MFWKALAGQIPALPRPNEYKAKSGAAASPPGDAKGVANGLRPSQPSEFAPTSQRKIVLMTRLPRLGVGTVQPGADVQPLVWGLLDFFQRHELYAQHFCSRACFNRLSAEHTITGQSSRHLDSWMMPADVCREVFAHSASKSDISVVEGQCPAPPCERHAGAAGVARHVGGCWQTLCRWLDLPVLVVLDVARLHDCRLPPRPERLDGLFLDGVADASDLCRWQTTIESLWGAPVLGALPQLPRLRAALADLPCGASPGEDACHALGHNLEAWLQPSALMRLASQREFPEVRDRLFLRSRAERTVTVAVAYDAAFGGYFPDALDLLELSGARLVDFSPLKHETLPPETEVVYFGCGHPERHAADLANNQCMIVALREHARAGKRIYAEGGGLAYLCQQLATEDGEWLPMSGVLPALAVRHAGEASIEPAEITLAADTWLGRRGERLRGYLNTSWDVRPLPGERGLVRLGNEPGLENAMIGRQRTLASRLHLNFAAQPAFLRGFLTANDRAEPVEFSSPTPG